MNIKDIEVEALALPREDRASLAHRLLLSLEEEVSDAEFDRVWAEESAKRAADADAKLGLSIPADEVAKKARALLR